MNNGTASGVSLLIPALIVSLAFLSAALYYLLQSVRRLRKENEDLTHEREVVFGFLHDIGDVFAHQEEADADQLIQRVLFYATRTTKAVSGAIYLYDQEQRAYFARAVSGLFPPLLHPNDPVLEKIESRARHLESLVRSEPVCFGDGVIGEAAEYGVPILIEHAERDPRVPVFPPGPLHIRTIVLVPLREGDETIGVMVVVNRLDQQAFTQTDLNLLQALASQAAVSVHYMGLRQVLNEKQRIDHDLSVAHHIQMALMPKSIPRIPGLELAAVNLPAQEIGGDYYDFIRIDDDHLGIAIADVSGKGIVGAIMMSISRSVLRAQATTSLHPAEVLRGVNRVMVEDIAEDMFVSMLYMVLNVRTKELRVARAGHERPLWSRDGDTGLTVVDSSGIALGMADGETFESTLNEVTIGLHPGDVVVAYTDGVTEALNAEREEWGVELFMEAIRVSAPDGANAVLNNVQQRVMRFVGGVGQSDDMTLLALRIIP